MATFFTSDHHFGDAPRLRIERRPYPDIRAMDEGYVALWNAVVGPDDTVWHLGDFALTSDHAAAILPRLNGTKHLLAGNNDPPGALALPGWASAGHYAEVTVDGVGLVLGHYAFRTWNGMGGGGARARRNLHGHSHGKLTRVSRQHDVGVDVWGGRPVTIAEITRRRGAPLVEAGGRAPARAGLRRRARATTVTR